MEASELNTSATGDGDTKILEAEKAEKLQNLSLRQLPDYHGNFFMIAEKWTWWYMTLYEHSVQMIQFQHAFGNVLATSVASRRQTGYEPGSALVQPVLQSHFYHETQVLISCLPSQARGTNHRLLPHCVHIGARPVSIIPCSPGTNQLRHSHAQTRWWIWVKLRHCHRKPLQSGASNRDATLSCMYEI